MSLIHTYLFVHPLFSPHLTFCTQLHWPSTWNPWWSSPTRTNQSNRTMMTMSPSLSSRSATSRHPAYRLSHRYAKTVTSSHRYHDIHKLYLSIHLLFSLFCQQMDIFDQAFGPPNGGFDDRWAWCYFYRNLWLFNRLFGLSTLSVPEHSDSLYSSFFVQQGSPDRELEAGFGVVESRAGKSKSRGKDRFTLFSLCIVEGIIIYEQRNLGQILGGCKCCSWRVECGK